MQRDGSPSSACHHLPPTCGPALCHFSFLRLYQLIPPPGWHKLHKPGFEGLFPIFEDFVISEGESKASLRRNAEFQQHKATDLVNSFNLYENYL